MCFTCVLYCLWLCFIHGVFNWFLFTMKRILLFANLSILWLKYSIISTSSFLSSILPTIHSCILYNPFGATFPPIHSPKPLQSTFWSPLSTIFYFLFITPTLFPHHSPPTIKTYSKKQVLFFLPIFSSSSRSLLFLPLFTIPTIHPHPISPLHLLPNPINVILSVFSQQHERIYRKQQINALYLIGSSTKTQLFTLPSISPFNFFLYS